MEHAEAVAIRTRNLQGLPVGARELEQALEVIRSTVTPTKRVRYKAALGEPTQAQAQAYRNNPWGLTQIQCEVLEMVAAGVGRQEIAAERGLHVKSVDGHVTRARERMDAASMTHAAVLWDRFARKGAA